MSYTPPTAALDAALDVAYASPDVMSAALTAAAPYIQAAALREAADDSRMGPVPYGWNASGVASWLRARADQLEGETNDQV